MTSKSYIEKTKMLMHNSKVMKASTHREKGSRSTHLEKKYNQES